MQFNSLVYLAFLPTVALLYWISGPRLRLLLLLVASYLFYGFWDYRFLSLIALSSAVDFAAGLRIHSSNDRRSRDRWLLLSLCVNLGALGFFKYYNFFADSLVTALEALHVPASLPALSIVLPVGISFYTFQTMAYTIDVYRGDTEPCRDALAFFVYVSFFPQLVAGPIERAGSLLPQILAPRALSAGRVKSGAALVLRGLFKKVVVADTAATLVNRVFDTPHLFSGPVLLLATYAFAVQIYGDFSGYTDIARGSARILGIELMENFQQPYFARNITEFWRRWHISLSSWLRDYLYIPLGGNRLGRVRTYLNLMVVMLLGGLWHGASWNFVIWGGLHGALLTIHRATRGPGGDRAPSRSVPDLVHLAVTFHLVCLGWIFFRAVDLGTAATIVSRIALASPGDAPVQLMVLPLVITASLFLDLLATRDRDARIPILNRPAVRGLGYGLAAVLIAICWDRDPVPFVYFQF